MRGYRKWAFPLVVIGMNSIAAYLIAHLCERFIVRFVPHPPGRRTSFLRRPRPRTAAARHGGAAGLLADPVLDVPAQDLPENLTLISLRRVRARPPERRAESALTGPPGDASQGHRERPRSSAHLHMP